MRRLSLAVVIVLVCALAPAQQTQERADRVLVHKKERTLQLLSKGIVIRTYKIALGGSPEGHKQQQGDQKTPEGEYTIDFRNPRSQFYKSLHISYPNARDRTNARRLKVHPGGDIFIHGLGTGIWGAAGKTHTLRDWTLGCIAVTNEEIDEIWKLVPDGTKIEIRP